MDAIGWHKLPKSDAGCKKILNYRDVKQQVIYPLHDKTTRMVS